MQPNHPRVLDRNAFHSKILSNGASSISSQQSSVDIRTIKIYSLEKLTTFMAQSVFKSGEGTNRAVPFCHATTSTCNKRNVQVPSLILTTVRTMEWSSIGRQAGE